MRQVLTLVLLYALVLVLAPAALADWPHDVKWDQLTPAEYGFSSHMTAEEQRLVADDFLCTETGWITDIEFYGHPSSVAAISSFRITFWSDVPASDTDESHPGQLLDDITVRPADPGDPLRLGWQYLDNFRFKIDLPQDQWFGQQAGTIYWIGIQAYVSGEGEFFGWVFRDPNENTWGDDAALGRDEYVPTTWEHFGWNAAMTPWTYTGKFPTNLVKSADMCFRLTGIVPEPATLTLVGFGAILLGFIRTRRK